VAVEADFLVVLDFLSDPMNISLITLNFQSSQRITPLFLFLLLHDLCPKQTNTYLIFQMQKQKKPSHFVAGRSSKRKTR
jgi:ABC-type phosphate transport system ATPase subunit